MQDQKCLMSSNGFFTLNEPGLFTLTKSPVLEEGSPERPVSLPQQSGVVTSEGLIG